MSVSELVKLTAALVAIVDIPGNVPMFLVQTAGMSGRERRVTAVVTAGATGAILLLFANFGESILSSFGISIDAFRVLGGIVVLLVALDMLGLLGNGAIQYGSTENPDPIVTGVFPLAVPLFAGPGAITAVMIYAHKVDVHEQFSAHVSLIIILVSIAIAFGLLAASLLARVIGPVTQVVMNRLLGMVVGALGIEFVLEGLAGFFG